MEINLKTVLPAAPLSSGPTLSGSQFDFSPSADEFIRHQAAPRIFGNALVTIVRAHIGTG